MKLCYTYFFSSGVTLLEGARGQGMAGCPLIKRLRKVQKIEERNAREPCSVGSRGPPKGPGGVQGQSPWWGSRGRSPRKLLCISMRIDTAFPTQTDIGLHQIVKFKGVLHPRPAFGLFLHFSQKLQQIGNK